MVQKISYTKLAAALSRGTKKGSKRKKSTWESRNYPSKTYYKQYLPRDDTSLATYGATWRNANDAQRAARNADRMVGRGRYDWRKGVRTAAGVSHALAPIGSQLALASGNPGLAMGITAGDRALGAVSNMSGHGMYMGGRGMYTVGNSLINGMGTSIPEFGTIGDETGALVVTHSEFIKDIYGLPSGEVFQNTSISLNPGLTQSFPFLSQIASNFEEYEMVQLMFTYKPKLSENLSSTDGQVGSIIMYTDYNSDDPPKVSKQQMLQAYGVTNGRIVDTLLHGVECDPSKIKGDGHKFIRVHPPDTNTNRDDYDAGLFQLAVMSTPPELVDQVLGELHVSYKVLLRKPRVYSLYAFAMDRDEFLIKTDAVDTTSLVAPIQFGRFNSIGCAIELVGDGQIEITFPASFSGPVKISMSKAISGGIGTLGTLVQPNTTTGNVTQSALLTDPALTTPTPTWRAPYSAEAANRCFAVFTYRIEQAESGTDNKITVGTRYEGTGLANIHLTVERYNSFDSDNRQDFV